MVKITSTKIIKYKLNSKNPSSTYKTNSIERFGEHLKSAMGVLMV